MIPGRATRLSENDSGTVGTHLYLRTGKDSLAQLSTIAPNGQ